MIVVLWIYSLVMTGVTLTALLAVQKVQGENRKLKDLLLSDPHEDTMLANFLELKWKPGGIMTVDGVDVEGTSWRQIARQHVLRERITKGELTGKQFMDAIGL